VIHDLSSPMYMILRWKITSMRHFTGLSLATPRSHGEGEPCTSRELAVVRER
jgi:hypothetical protein